jgi:hypothetical protein
VDGGATASQVNRGSADRRGRWPRGLDPRRCSAQRGPASWCMPREVPIYSDPEASIPDRAQGDAWAVAPRRPAIPLSRKRSPGHATGDQAESPLPSAGASGLAARPSRCSQAPQRSARPPRCPAAVSKLGLGTDQRLGGVGSTGLSDGAGSSAAASSSRRSRRAQDAPTSSLADPG